MNEKKLPVKKVPKSQTAVPYEKTMAEIQKHLVQAGAKKIIFDYDDANLPCALNFAYQTKQGMMFFALPLRFGGMEKVLIANRRSRDSRITDDQVINTAWRILKDWILAQLAIVDAEMAELAEVFLPYSQTPSGDTLWEAVKKMDEPPFKLLNQ